LSSTSKTKTLFLFTNDSVKKRAWMPDGLGYVQSWTDDKMERCFQLMETENRALLDEWMAQWSDLIDFEVHVVVSSSEAAQRSGA
jgi:hypothetical protein